VTGEVHTGYWLGVLREPRRPSVDGCVILKWIFKKWDGAMGWIVLAQDEDRWRTLVNAVTKIRVP